MGPEETRPLYRVLRDAPEAADEIVPADVDPAVSERRFQRNTYVVIALAVTISLIFAQWRTTAGVILGGALSIFNERWLRSSTAVILGVAAQTRNPRLPRWTAAKFLLRYLVVALIAGAAVWSGWFSILGICLGLASFVGALMIEAGYQFYLTFRTVRSDEPTDHSLK